MGQEFPKPIFRQDEDEEGGGGSDGGGGGSGGGGGGSGGEGAVTKTGPDLGAALFPVYVVSGIFAVLFFFGPCFVRKGPDQGVIKCSIMIAIFSIWLFWVTIYISQINPLMGPRLDNVSLAWLGHCWGDDPKKLSNPT